MIGSPGICWLMGIGWFSTWSVATAAGWLMPVTGGSSSPCTRISRRRRFGANPPGIVDDPEFMALLGKVAAGKPANPDMYTSHLVEFVETFAGVLGDPALPHLFFVDVA